jgi:sigma-B regulation protein RsbU (phosphoserine phosphatase)
VTRLALLWTTATGPVVRELAGAELVLGRSEDCDVVLADRAVSRRHARVVAGDGGWWLEDLGSRGGTLLNGRPLTGRERLGAGDLIELGQSVVEVADRARPGSTASGPLAPGTSLFLRADDLLAGTRAPAAPGEELATLERRAARLELLNEVHRALGRSVALEELLELILDRAFEALEPEEGVIVLRDAPGAYRRAAARRPAGSLGDALLSHTLLEEVVEKRQSALVCDISADERFGQAASLRLSGVRSLIAAPLYDEAGPLGMISLDSRAFVRPFGEEDLELLTSLAAVASLRIRNVALAEEAAERRRLEEELALARSIQIGLLPRELPTPPGWSVFGSSVPSRFVSGDYYFLAAHESALVAMLADVSGKGIGAALLTASLEALAAGPLEAGLAPEEVFARVSRLLYRRTPASKYATAVLARTDLASGRTRLANAGHNAPLVVRAAGQVETLAATGRPLGLLAEGDYGARELELAPGDLLVVYSDGLVEAADAAEQEFGLERMIEVVRAERGAPLPAIGRALEEALRAFVGGEPDADDRTLVLVRRNP